MTWLTFVVGVLATFRLSLMVSKEDGPAYVFRKLRRLPPKKSATHEWLSCIFCFSVTASALVTWYLWHIGLIDLNQSPLYWLAFSAGSIIINQQFTKGEL